MHPAREGKISSKGIRKELLLQFRLVLGVDTHVPRHVTLASNMNVAYGTLRTTGYLLQTHGLFLD